MQSKSAYVPGKKRIRFVCWQSVWFPSCYFAKHLEPIIYCVAFPKHPETPWTIQPHEPFIMILHPKCSTFHPTNPSAGSTIPIPSIHPSIQPNPTQPNHFKGRPPPACSTALSYEQRAQKMLFQHSYHQLQGSAPIIATTGGWPPCRCKELHTPGPDQRTRSDSP